ncbi:MAG: peptide chain release factor N(5)-glutamine methyltransferase [Pirellulales bacterium]
MSDAWTIGRLLKWTADYLGQHGADSPRLEAELLLAAARGCQRIELYTAFDETPPDAVRTAFRELVKRRAEGAPVAYLLGQREFFSLPLKVTPDVLIPRPETEHLVIAALDLARGRAPQGAGLKLADIGTGSGAIAIALAKHLPQATVTAVDLSPSALAVAAENAATHGVAERVTFLQSDLLAALPAAATFDLIASNPPYVSSAEWQALSPGVRDFEPRQALEAGPAGTEVIERLIPQAVDRLKPGGWLLLEVSPMIEPQVVRLIVGRAELRSLPTRKDSAGLARVVIAQKVA